MKTVKLEIVFPDTFTEADIEITIDAIRGLMPSVKGLVPSVEFEHTLFNKILNWAGDKGILTHGDAKTQMVKLSEEKGELAKAILKNDVNEVKDAIGDMIVVMTSIAYFHGLSVPQCMQSAYDVINKRKGNMVDGNFVKDY